MEGRWRGIGGLRGWGMGVREWEIGGCEEGLGVWGLGDWG